MIVAVAHQKGGCSKTTLAINIAVELNVSDCFDLDLAKGGTTGISWLAKLRENAGHKKLQVTPINHKEDLIKAIESDHDEKIMIMDLGGLDSDVNRIALAYADLVITPANESSLEVGGLIEFSRMIKEVDSLTGRDIKIHVIAARTHYAKKKWDSLTNTCSKRDNLIFSGISMPQYTDYADSLAEGQTVLEYNAKGNAAKHMRVILEYIKNALK
ncbi:ParA family protein [Moritella viscosa]|uniref:Plasmid partitioning protein n=1 Tax=Moritella viscosa TaxID=80854 RepID=A0ABY1HKJ2_9GAMM|nr:ParA family protein [Moritella viscosa]SGZ00509.1 Plasmid partitioning protein [Moritella viscosa]SGZ10323.1 Plasmid partitioning protein [Moritella viscosa]SHO14587.1 Plasmid partitioning protein [Moritella viscosa]SHO15437.1 Plasmid partitioning protein [Moritella viscosa]SHO18930.1 Plasmid partitioning protein [Moritella viscosa]